MAQVVIYGLRDVLRARRTRVSDAVHGAVMAALAYPPEKRFHRFVGLDPEDFIYPEDRGPDYTIIEVSLFEGRSEDARRSLIRELFSRLESEAGIPPPAQRGDHHHRDAESELGYSGEKRRRPRAGLPRRRVTPPCGRRPR